MASGELRTPSRGDRIKLALLPQVWNSWIMTADLSVLERRLGVHFSLDSLQFGFPYLPTYHFLYPHKNMVSVPGHQLCVVRLWTCTVAHCVYWRWWWNCISPPPATWTIPQSKMQYPKNLHSLCLLGTFSPWPNTLLVMASLQLRKPSWAVTKTTLMPFRHCGEHSSTSPSIFVCLLLYFIHFFFPPTRLFISQSCAMTEIYCTAKCWGSCGLLFKKSRE